MGSLFPGILVLSSNQSDIEHCITCARLKANCAVWLFQPRECARVPSDSHPASQQKRSSWRFQYPLMPAHNEGEAVLTFSPNIHSSTPGAMGLYEGAEPSPGYRLRRVRGRGGFAEVWEADSPSGTPVALKFMPSSNATTTARELRSIQSFLALDHPHLVKTHGVWSVPGYIVINMELAEATLLDLMLVYHNDLCQQIDPPLLCLYLWQVSDALDFLNARKHPREGRKIGIQHGDVKPNNILLFGDSAKLTDHGLATPTHGPITPCSRQGTREYAPPEVFVNHLSDTSDQYSLAVTYYVLRTGRFPFPPPPVPFPKGYIRPLPDLSGVTEAEQPALMRALAPVPQDRFPNCRDLMSALLKAHAFKTVRNEDGAWKVVREDPSEAPPARPIKSSSRLRLK
jgi:serine/threonine protein kinase, bacterial